MLGSIFAASVKLLPDRATQLEKLSEELDGRAETLQEKAEQRVYEPDDDRAFLASPDDLFFSRTSWTQSRPLTTHLSKENAL